MSVDPSDDPSARAIRLQKRLGWGLLAMGVVLTLVGVISFFVVEDFWGGLGIAAAGVVIAFGAHKELSFWG